MVNVANKARTRVLPPDPRRLIEGLRDTGYQFNTALADIIDNSIAAGATQVDVGINMDFRGNIQVHVVDDGCGMDFDGLLNAMTYGSNARANRQSLGKFGLGLKTASTSCCRRLSVVSRDAVDHDTNKLVWDLDHVEKVGDWEVLIDSPSKDETKLLVSTTQGSGTLVLWDRCDRVLKQDYQKPGGRPAQKALRDLISRFKRHASVVYQRFLDPADSRAQNVVIRVNGEALEAWDPFCLWAPNTELVAQDDVVLVLPDETEASANIRAYVIPRKDEAAPEDQDRLRVSNENQGIYVYRENRLIHFGDWLGMFRKEPHLSLIRVEFSFDHKLDEAFNVDIKKSQVQLAHELYIWLKETFLPAPRRAAEERYRKGERRKINKAGQNAHDASNNAIAVMEEGLRQSVITVDDPDTGEVEVTNRIGTVKLKMPVKQATADNIVVEPMDGLADGLLWEPALIGQRHGFYVNTTHPYYHKVYLPNLDSGVTVRGLDSLLWALSEAELGTINETTKNYLRDLRYEVSKLLRRLVETLPEPELDDSGLDSE